MKFPEGKESDLTEWIMKEIQEFIKVDAPMNNYYYNKCYAKIYEILIIQNKKENV